MLNDLQRLDYAEAMIKMDEASKEAFLQEKGVTETTDIDVINQLIVDLTENNKLEAEMVQAFETGSVPDTDPSM